MNFFIFLNVNANMAPGPSDSGVCSRIYAKLTSPRFVNAPLAVSSFLKLFLKKMVQSNFEFVTSNLERIK